MTHLSPFNRRLLRYRGIPAAHVAQAEHCTIAQVLAGWEQLRMRGHLPTLTEPPPTASEQMSLGELDQLMREPPSSVEIDCNTETDPNGW